MNDHLSRDHSPVGGSPGAYAVVLLLVTIFILYGSLFPFEYYERSYPGGPVRYLLSTWSDWDHRGDLLSNILLYMPFGFFGTLALPSFVAARRRALIITIIGTALSCCVEITQFHDVGRVTSMGDVYANAIGSGAGASLAVAIGASIRWPFVREAVSHPAASILIIVFVGYRLYPYVPMIDMHKYWHAVRPMLESPSLPPGELASALISWLLVSAMVHRVYGFNRFLLLFPLLCGGEFLGRILIINTALTWADVIGALAAYLLWAMRLHRMPARFAIVAAGLAILITVERLAPFRFVATPHAFDWVPFASMMREAVGPEVQVFCQDVFEFGGLIWLLGSTGVMLPIGTLVTAVLLLAIGFVQCWLPARPAEITNSLMVVLIGGVFMLLRYAARQRSNGTGVTAAAAREQALLTEAVRARRGAASDNTATHW